MKPGDLYPTDPIQKNTVTLNNVLGDADLATNILRLPAVVRRTGLSRSTIYLRISEGSFPKQISLGGRAVGFLEAEIEEWLAAQVAQSRQVDEA